MECGRVGGQPAGMTTTPALEHLALRSPDALLSALPYLLGFHPVESAVVVWLSERRILLVQRMDLPEPDVPADAWHDALWGHEGAGQADELVLVLVTDGPADADLVARVVDTAERSGLEVRDVLRLRGGRWWSLMCSDEDCCPAEGRPVDAGTAARIAAEFTVLGRAPAADRAALRREYDPDPVAIAGLTAVPRGPEPGDREAWRDDRIAALLDALGGAGAMLPDAVEASGMLAALADIRVRDTVLWHLSRWTAEPLASAAAVLACLVRMAPPGRVAPVATCAALVAWLSGDGARALVALDRASADDPAYSLATLLSASLAAGLPPRAWRESMAGLTRRDCRHGATPGG